MPTSTKKSTPATTSKAAAAPTADAHDHMHHYRGSQHYSELARINAILFVGVLALMTFLLTAGLQHPQPLFSFFVYAAIVSLPLSLVAYTIGHSIQQYLWANPAGPGKKSGTQVALMSARITQQVLFIVSLIVVTGLALVSAHIFFSPPAAAPTAQSQAQTQ